MKRVAILTSEATVQLDEDSRLLVARFAERGVEARPLIWTLDEGLDFDAVVVRPVWDRLKKPHTFVEWITRRERLGTQLFNDLKFLRWGLSGKHMADLAGTGLPVQSDADSVTAATDLGMGRVSASVINGRLSHLYHLNPDSDTVVFSRTGDDQRLQELAERAVSVSKLLAGSEQDAMFARVDLVPNGSGEWQVARLNVVDPTLDLYLEPQVVSVIADAITAEVAWGK